MSERKGRVILRVTGLIGAAAIALTGIWSAFASTPTPPFIGADVFIDENCAVCHSSPTGPGRLDLKNLSFEPANPDNFAIWVKVYDSVAAGEMPPAGMPQPAAAARTQFVKGLDTALTSWEKKVAAERGRAGLRRLNNYEYENSIRDLLNVP